MAVKKKEVEGGREDLGGGKQKVCTMIGFWIDNIKINL